VCDAGNAIGFDGGATDVTAIAKKKKKQVLQQFYSNISYQIKNHWLLNHQQF